jgi:PAS domain-containing protein
MLKSLRRSKKAGSQRGHDVEFETVLADLALTEQSFRAAFDDSPGPVAMVAGRGESDGRLLQVNPAFARMLGMSVADLHLREIASITHADDRDRDAAPTTDGGTTGARRGAPVGRP